MSWSENNKLLEFYDIILFIMKSKVNYLCIILIIIAVIVAGYFIYINLISPKQIDTSVNDTKLLTYTNTKYGYTLNYPENALLQKTYEMESGPDSESRAIQIGGGNTYIDIEYSPMNPTISEAVNGTADKEYERRSKLDLKSYVNEIRNNMINKDDINFSNVSVSDLKEITIDGRSAYYIDVEENQKLGNDYKRLIFVENGKDRFEIKYSVDYTDSQKIIDSFRFVK